MKRIINICVFVCLLHTASGQDSLTTTLYGGLLSSTSYNLKTGTPDPSASLRVGASIYWKLGKKVSFTSFGVFDASPGSISGFQVYSLSYKPSTKWQLSVGHMPTPSTELRPFPVSAFGQFETWTQARIPGAAPGVKGKYFFGKDISFSGGVALRSQIAEYHSQVQLKKLVVSAYFSKNQKGVAAAYTGDATYSIVVCNEKIIANTTVFKLVPRLNLKYWSDIGIDHKEKVLVRCEGGILRTFELPKTSLKGLVALGYDGKKEAVTAYLFIHF